MKSSFLCHGRSERCLSFRGYRFPLCSRCTGIYAGFLLVLIYEYFSSGLPVRLLPLFAIMIIPTAIDGATQLIGDRESTNLVRVLTGLCAGIGLMFIIRITRNIVF